MRPIFPAALATAAFLLFPFCNVNAQLVTLRYGQIPSTIKTISALSFSIGQRKGLFAQEGINLEMMPIEGGAANMVIALENFPVFVPQFGQAICCTKSRRSRADNNDLLAQAGLLQFFSVYSNVARSTPNLSPPRTP